MFSFLIFSYPLLHLPLPGNLPLQIWGSGSNGSGLEVLAGKPPWCYVQQVVLRTAVMPWDPNLYLSDAFRAPLYEAFKLLDVVRNFQESQRFVLYFTCIIVVADTWKFFSSKSLGHVCLHVEAIKKSKDAKSNILPQYSCLVLSPANLWHQDVQQFAQDPTILSTIFNHQVKLDSIQF